MNKLVKKWILFAFLISLMDQFYFVCLSWFLFSSFSANVASSLLALLSLLRLLGLVVSPSIAQSSGSLYCVFFGLVGRTASFLLTCTLLALSGSWIYYIFPLCFFAASDGVLIPASSMVLREISFDDEYVASLGGMQVALSVSLGLSALFAGSALVFLNPLVIMLILLLLSFLTLLYFVKVRVEIIGACTAFSSSEYFSILSFFRNFAKTSNIFRILLQIFSLEVVLAGSLNVALPHLFSREEYGSFSFSLAVCLFVFGGILGGLLLRFYRALVDYPLFYSISQLVLAVVFIFCAYGGLYIYLLSFFSLGLLGALLAPFLTSRFIDSLNGSEGVSAFSALSLFSYGAIFLSYSLFSFLMYLVDIREIFAYFSFVFFALALLNRRL